MVATLLMAGSSGSVVAGIFRYLPVWQVLICCLGQGVASQAGVWRNTGRDMGVPGHSQGHKEGEGGTVDIYVTQNCRALICLLLFTSLSRRLMRLVFFLFALQ